MDQEFYSNVSSKFFESGGFIYVRCIKVSFNPSVICFIFGLDVSTASDISIFNTVTCHYDMIAYHREPYLDSFIPLVKRQASKSRLKPVYRTWLDFICRNVLGSSNKGNPTFKLVVPFGYIIFKSILSKADSLGRQHKGSTV